MEMQQLGEQVLASQPFSQLLGAECVAFAEGHMTLRVPLRPELNQQFGTVHGGVIGYAADNALTFAGGSVLGPDVVTAEYKINYLRPARGVALLARADVLRSSARQAVCQCQVMCVAADGSETLVAVALGTIMTRG